VRRRPVGIAALSIFFAFGAAMSGLTAILLAFPGSSLDTVWNLNPVARDELAALGMWAIVLMLGVCVACAAAAIGLWKGAAWGRRLAVGILVVNLIGDVTNAIVRSDPRTLIGIPIAGAMIAYLLSRHARSSQTPLK